MAKEKKKDCVPGINNTTFACLVCKCTGDFVYQKQPWSCDWYHKNTIDQCSRGYKVVEEVDALGNIYYGCESRGEIPDKKCEICTTEQIDDPAGIKKIRWKRKWVPINDLGVPLDVDTDKKLDELADKCMACNENLGWYSLCEIEQKREKERNKNPRKITCNGKGDCTFECGACPECAPCDAERKKVCIDECPAGQKCFDNGCFCILQAYSHKVAKCKRDPGCQEPFIEKPNEMCSISLPYVNDDCQCYNPCKENETYAITGTSCECKYQGWESYFVEIECDDYNESCKEQCPQDKPAVCEDETLGCFCCDPLDVNYMDSVISQNIIP